MNSETQTDHGPEMSLRQAQATVARKTAPRVIQEEIEAKIARTEYVVHGQTTIAFIIMKNGFSFVGKSAPASPENYDEKVGRRYAYEDAFKQIWSHEGYLLCQKLTDDGVRPAQGS